MTSYEIKFFIPWDSRESFLSEVFAYIDEANLKSFQGLDEGSVNETQSGEFDDGEASRKRDWIAERKENEAIVFYFSDLQESEKFYEHFQNYERAEIASVEPRDWNEKWKSSFQGLDIPPFWRIRPSWNPSEASSLKLIHLDPSMGFGFGTHPTTASCLQALGEMGDLRNKTILDFGSGSGILSVAACRLNAKRVIAVEIDDPARESSRQCIAANACEQIVRLYKFIPEDALEACDLVVANIISSVLKTSSDLLLRCTRGESRILLSGILLAEEGELQQHYEESFAKHRISYQLESRLEMNGWVSFLYSLVKTYSKH